MSSPVPADFKPAAPRPVHSNTGYVPVKPEYLAPAPPPEPETPAAVEPVAVEAATAPAAAAPAETAAVTPETAAVPETAEAEGKAKTRGMNKGSERAHFNIAGTGGPPSFDGEVNFLSHDVLKKAKQVIKDSKALVQSGGKPEGLQKRDRDADETRNDAPTAAAAPAAPVTDAAPAAVAETKEAAAVQAVVKKDDEPAAARRKRLFENKLVLAPLTTVGNLPFRRVCKGFGVDVTVGEMAMSNNINHTQKSEWSLLRRHKSEDIFGVQIAAARGGEAALTARLLEESEFDYDFVDLNCGCPVDLMVRKGCGCGLWEKKNRMHGVVEALVRWQPKPVSVKVRIGPDEATPQLHKVVHEYESWGASAVTIHGRSRKQRYSRLANWAYIEQCAQFTSLPVIGNGDVFNPEDYVERREIAPSVTSMMVGRGALIKPWVFKEVKEGQLWDIRSSERLDMLKDFADYGLAHWGADERGVATTRRYMCEWLSFLHRYVPVGILEQTPQRMNDRPPQYVGRDDLETLMASEFVGDWVKITELLLGPAGDSFKFTPKHKSNSYATPAQLQQYRDAAAGVATAAAPAEPEDEAQDEG